MSTPKRFKAGDLVRVEKFGIKNEYFYFIVLSDYCRINTYNKYFYDLYRNDGMLFNEQVLGPAKKLC